MMWAEHSNSSVTQSSQPRHGRIQFTFDVLTLKLTTMTCLYRTVCTVPTKHLNKKEFLCAIFANFFSLANRS